jgi:hypothetical protein
MARINVEGDYRQLHGNPEQANKRDQDSRFETLILAPSAYTHSRATGRVRIFRPVTRRSVLVLCGFLYGPSL